MRGTKEWSSSSSVVRQTMAEKSPVTRNAKVKWKLSCVLKLQKVHLPRSSSEINFASHPSTSNRSVPFRLAARPQDTEAETHTSREEYNRILQAAVFMLGYESSLSKFGVGRAAAAAATAGAVAQRRRRLP